MSQALPQAAFLFKNVFPRTEKGRDEVSWDTGGGIPPRFPAAVHTDVAVGDIGVIDVGDNV